MTRGPAPGIEWRSTGADRTPGSAPWSARPRASHRPTLRRMNRTGGRRCHRATCAHAQPCSAHRNDKSDAHFLVFVRYRKLLLTKFKDSCISRIEMCGFGSFTHTPYPAAPRFEHMSQSTVHAFRAATGDGVDPRQYLAAVVSLRQPQLQEPVPAQAPRAMIRRPGMACGKHLRTTHPLEDETA